MIFKVMGLNLAAFWRTDEHKSKDFSVVQMRSVCRKFESSSGQCLSIVTVVKSNVKYKGARN